MVHQDKWIMGGRNQEEGIKMMMVLSPSVIIEYRKGWELRNPEDLLKTVIPTTFFIHRPHKKRLVVQECKPNLSVAPRGATELSCPTKDPLIYLLFGFRHLFSTQKCKLDILASQRPGRSQVEEDRQAAQMWTGMEKL